MATTDFDYKAFNEFKKTPQGNESTPPPINIRERKRRYWLHQKIKKSFRYSAIKRTIYVDFDHDLKDKNVLELKDRFGYNVQTEIPVETAN